MSALAHEDDCTTWSFWSGTLTARSGVPLAHLRPVFAEESAVQALADWRYRVERGYQF